MASVGMALAMGFAVVNRDYHAGLAGGKQASATAPFSARAESVIRSNRYSRSESWSLAVA
jgi:hypothetical protein